MWATLLRSGFGCLMALWILQGHASSQWLAPDHPNTYQVQQGDTLWDIAGRFLNDPWRWPQVWKASDLENPHLIYPGDLIVLTMDGEEPNLSVRRNNNTQKTIYKDGQKTVKLTPRIRSESPERAIPTIALSSIGPFLSHSKVTRVGGLEDGHKIASVDEERLLVSEGYRFYVANLDAPQGEVLSVFRAGRVLIHPKSGEELGQEAIYLGSAKVETTGNMSTLYLQKGVEEVHPGDYLLPIEKDRVEPYYFPKLPEKEGRGFILTVLGGINQIGRNQVIVISGGEDIQREEGDVLTVLQEKSDFSAKVKKREKFEKLIHPGGVEQLDFASTQVGRVIVFKVFEKTSLALVMDAIRTIHLRDEVRRP